MELLPSDILFIEHGEAEITETPHCGGCFGGAEEIVTDKPHCGGCEV